MIEYQLGELVLQIKRVYNDHTHPLTSSSGRYSALYYSWISVQVINYQWNDASPFLELVQSKPYQCGPTTAPPGSPSQELSHVRLDNTIYYICIKHTSNLMGMSWSGTQYVVVIYRIAVNNFRVLNDNRLTRSSFNIQSSRFWIGLGLRSNILLESLLFKHPSIVLCAELCIVSPAFKHLNLDIRAISNLPPLLIILDL